MRVLIAARALLAGEIDPATLFSICTPAEHVQVALLTGRTDSLPLQNRNPIAALRSLNSQQRKIVEKYAPDSVKMAISAAKTGEKPVQFDPETGEIG